MVAFAETNDPKVRLFPFQVESVQEIDQADGRTLVALPMGLGKTLISLKWLQRHPEALPALVVAPASVKYNWPYEANHFFGIRMDICEGQTPPRHHHRDGFGTQSKITIINYDILKYWVPHLKKLGFKTLVFDEVQNLSNPRSQRSRAAKEIAKGLPFILGLSGTPLMNRPAELWPILNMIWPEAYPSFWSYSQLYCNPKWTPWGWNHSGASNLDQLHRELVARGMVRRRKEDVLKDLPDKVRRIVPCELSRPEEYQEATDDFLAWMRKNHGGKVRNATKAEGLAKVGYLLRLIARLKIRPVVEWANRFLEETDEKLILFAIHKKAIEVLKNRVNAKYVVIDGSVTGRDRQSAVDQFQKDKSTRLCIGSSAAWTGITLTAASEIGVVELPWRPGDVTQLEDRAHRIGQRSTVFVNFLIAPGTLEDRMCRILQEKQQTSSAVLDGGPNDNDLNVYDELMRTLQGRLF